MKFCKNCKTQKNFEQFYKNKSKNDGLQSQCIDCQKISYPSSIICVDCSKIFVVNHRNLKKRKTKSCKECLSKKIAERNTKGTSEFIYSTKKYKYIKNKDKKGYTLAHRKIMEEKINRVLSDDEVIHHLDGNKENNEISNLLITDKKTHGQIHKSLESVALQLYKIGLVKFDIDLKKYQLAVIDRIDSLEKTKKIILGITDFELTKIITEMNNFIKLKELNEEIEFLKKLFKI